MSESRSQSRSSYAWRFGFTEADDEEVQDDGRVSCICARMCVQACD